MTYSGLPSQSDRSGAFFAKEEWNKITKSSSESYPKRESAVLKVEVALTKYCCAIT